MSGSVVLLNGPGPYTITGSTTGYGVQVDSPGGAEQVTLDSATINVSGFIGRAAFDCGSSAVEITLVGANSLQSGTNWAELQCADSASVTIDGGDSNSLTTTGGTSATTSMSKSSVTLRHMDGFLAGGPACPRLRGRVGG